MIALVAGEGKVRVLHQNLLFLFGVHIEEDPENDGNWQDANRPQDCILAVSDDGEPKLEVVLIDTKPLCEGDAIYVLFCKAVLTHVHNCYLFLYMKCIGELHYNSLYAMSLHSTTSSSLGSPFFMC